LCSIPAGIAHFERSKTDDSFAENGATAGSCEQSVPVYELEQPISSPGLTTKFGKKSLVEAREEIGSLAPPSLMEEREKRIAETASLRGNSPLTAHPRI